MQNPFRSYLATRETAPRQRFTQWSFVLNRNILTWYRRHHRSGHLQNRVAATGHAGLPMSLEEAGGTNEGPAGSTAPAVTGILYSHYPAHVGQPQADEVETTMLK